MAEQAAPQTKARKAPAPAKTKVNVAQHDIVGHGRDDARHVRCILLDGHEPTGIGRTGDEGQKKGKVTVRLFRAFPGCQFSEIVLHGVGVSK